MSLITRSEQFLATSLENPALFGWPVKLTNPLEQKQGFDVDDELYGQVRHINLLIDMDTGSDIQEEQASVTLRLSSMKIGEPKKDWVVDTTDTEGNEYHCYVTEAMPDRTMGLVILKLGLVEDSV